MKKFILIGIAGVLIVGGATIFFLLKSPGTNPPAQEGSGVESLFPEGEARVSIPGADGKLITVNNFVQDSSTNQVEGSTHTLYSLRDFSYEGTNFHAYYTPDQFLFTVSLVNEPLDQAREEAEIFLSQKLGISRYALCNLNYSVTTPSSPAHELGGRNLGFSLCKGSISL